MLNNFIYKNKLLIIILLVVLVVLIFTLFIIYNNRSTSQQSKLVKDGYNDSVEVIASGEPIIGGDIPFVFIENSFFFDSLSNKTLEQIRPLVKNFIRNNINSTEVKAVMNDSCDTSRPNETVCEIKTKDNTVSLYISVFQDERRNVTKINLVYNDVVESYNIN